MFENFVKNLSNLFSNVTPNITLVFYNDMTKNKKESKCIKKEQ